MRAELSRARTPGAAFAAAAIVTLVAATAAAYEGLDSFAAGTISGVVKITKTPDKAPALEVTKDPHICGQNLPDQTHVVGADGGLANTVVFVAGVRAGKKIGKPTAEITNAGCLFVPRVATFPVGTNLWVVNNDGTLHNVHAYLDGNTTLFNLALPTKGHRVPKKIKKAGIIEYRCDAGHTWMRGWAYVTDHPYATVTDKDGKFTIADVPAGRYKVRAWHEAAGEKEAGGKVKVEVGQTTAVEIVY